MVIAEWESLTEAAQIYTPIVALVLLCISGTVAGLNLSVFSLDVLKLRIAARRSKSTYERLLQEYNASQGKNHKNASGSAASPDHSSRERMRSSSGKRKSHEVSEAEEPCSLDGLLLPVESPQQQQRANHHGHNADEAPIDPEKARRLLLMLHHSHLVLVALLTTDVVCMILLPLVLHQMLPNIVAWAVSVSAMLVFGEILPQAIFVRYNVAVSAFLSPFVLLLIVVTFPVSWPLSKLLRCFMGPGLAEGIKKNRREVAELLRAATEAMEQSEEGSGGHGGQPHGAILPKQEAKLMLSILTLADATVGTNLTPVPPEQMFMLEAKTKITPEVVAQIVKSKHSRIPVYFGPDRSHIVGILVVKALLRIPHLLKEEVVEEDTTSNEKEKTSSSHFHPLPSFQLFDFPLRDPVRVTLQTPLRELYSTFRSGAAQMACIYDHSVLKGFCTMADVQGKILGLTFSSPQVSLRSLPTTTASDQHHSQHNSHRHHHRHSSSSPSSFSSPVHSTRRNSSKAKEAVNRAAALLEVYSTVRRASSSSNPHHQPLSVTSDSRW